MNREDIHFDFISGKRAKFPFSEIIKTLMIQFDIEYLNYGGLSTIDFLNYSQLFWDIKRFT